MDFKAIYESFERENRIEKIATEEDVKNYMSVEKVGDKFSIFPPPETREKALEWLEKYHGPIQAESLVKSYNRKYPKKIKPLQDQLDKINTFIEQANNLNSDDAIGDLFEAKNIPSNLKEHYEYLKWVCGHYEIKPYYPHSFFSDDLKRVYGKYVLYKQWLEDEIRQLKNPVYLLNPVEAHKNRLILYEKVNPKKELSIFESTKRQLSSIYGILYSQWQTKSGDVDKIINADGRYCLHIQIRSDRPLIEFADFQKHYSHRFENAKSDVLVKSELIELYHKADEINKFHEMAFSYQNETVKQVIDKYNADPNLRFDKEEMAYRTMIVLLVDYTRKRTLFGFGTGDENEQTIPTIRDYVYNRDNNNITDFCDDLINFVGSFGFSEVEGNVDTFNLKDTFDFTVTHRSDLPEQSIDDAKKKIPQSTYDFLDKLFEDVEFVDDTSFGNLKTVLADYLTNGYIPLQFADIQFSRINRKRIGSKFNALHKKFNKNIGLDFCKFCVSNINLWKDTKIEDENRFRNARIYKDCHDNSF